MKTSLLTKVLSLIVIAVLSGSAVNFSSAQLPQVCGTDAVMAERIKNDPEVLKVQQELEAFTMEFIRNHQHSGAERSGPPYIIPVVFHVIHDNGAENVPVSTIMQAINTLNQDFNKLNSDTSQVAPQFKSLIADCQIEFRLAQKDPDGNCTNGINRVYSYRTYQGNDRAKVVIWDRKNYLNIWVVNKLADPNVAAYAYLPAGASGLGYRVDGVISRFNYVGGANRTLSHEVGHSLNLSHTWGSGVVVTGGCGDDGVSDTPETEGSQQCPTNKVDFTCDKDTIKTEYQFDFVTTTSGSTEPNAPLVVTNPNGGDTALTLMNFSAVGVSANSTQDSVFAFSNWGTGAVDGDTAFANHTGTQDLAKYYEFTIRPQLGQGMTLTRLQFFVKRNATGPRMFAVRSSETTNFGSNITATLLSPFDPNIGIRPTNVFYIVNDTTQVVKSFRVTLSGAPYTNTDDTITFRIYAWNAEDASGTFEIDSVGVMAIFGKVENLDNYMDYTFCDNMFTWGQSERMHATLESPVSARNNLHTADNHTLTGIDNPQTCVPEADFYANKTMACLNTGTVSFFDRSQRGTPTSWSWTFPNGTPATSAAQNPANVSFGDLWNQSVTFTATNAAGSNTVTKNMVWVAPPWTDYVGLFYEDFESPSSFNNLWRVDNRYGNSSSWHVSNTGYFPSGNRGLKLNAFSPMIFSTNTTPQVVLDPGIGGFDKDAFITPSFNLSNIASGTGKLEFKLTGATRGSDLADITDNLRVKYSINCGNTWVDFPNANTVSLFDSSALSNAGSWQIEYTPTTSTQWSQKSITLPTAALANNVRFLFEYTSGDMSNNIYIDDINISGTVGIEDNNPAFSADMVVYPNPSGGDISVTYRISDSRTVKLRMYDAIGNLVYEVVNEKQAPGSYAVNFNASRLANGIYHIRLSGDNVNLKTEKVAIIK